MELAQDVVRDVASRLRLAVDVDRNVQIASPDLADECPDVVEGQRGFDVVGELLVVYRQDEGACLALLLCELAEVVVAGHAQRIESFRLDGLGQRADTEARRVLRTEILVDDDDRKVKMHGISRRGGG